MEWTGLGCDVCGFGSVEDCDKFNPRLPCPECGAVMLSLRRCILIPMRGGSKGIYRKNMTEFEGVPLCHHVLRAAVASIVPNDDIWVSTEDDEIADNARKFGVRVFDEPIELAQDDSPDIDVFQCFVEERGQQYDYIVHLRATYPRITSDIIMDAMDCFESCYDDCTSLRSVVPTSEIPHKMWNMTADGIHIRPVTGCYDRASMPRQLLPAAYQQNAAIDIIKCDTIRGGSMTGVSPAAYMMSSGDGVDIDTMHDMNLCEVKR